MIVPQDDSEIEGSIDSMLSQESMFREDVSRNIFDTTDDKMGRNVRLCRSMEFLIKKQWKYQNHVEKRDEKMNRSARDMSR